MGHTWEIKLNIRMVQALEALSQSLGGGENSPFFCRELNYFRNRLAGEMSCGDKRQVIRLQKNTSHLTVKTKSAGVEHLFVLTVRNV